VELARDSPSFLVLSLQDLGRQFAQPLACVQQFLGAFLNSMLQLCLVYPELRFPLSLQSGNLQSAADTSQQFSRGKGLYQVIVCTRLDTFDSRFFARTGGKKDDRNGTRLLICPQRLEKLKAIEYRHHYVANDEIRGIIMRGLKSRLTVSNSFHFVLLRQ